jgi:hypothetical protein
MKTISTAAAVLTLLSSAVCAEAEMSNGNYMLPHYKNLINQDVRYEFKQSAFLGIIKCIVFLPDGNSRPACSNTPAARLSQLVGVAVRYMETRQKDLHKSFKSLIVTALEDAGIVR